MKGLQASSQWKLPQWYQHWIIGAHVHSMSMYEPYMYNVCTMYVHGINSCLNRFSWSTERCRCRTEGHPSALCVHNYNVHSVVVNIHRRVCTVSIHISTSMYMSVTCTYKDINTCTCMYHVQTLDKIHVHVCTCMHIYVHVHSMYIHVYTCT